MDPNQQPIYSQPVQPVLSTPKETTSAITALLLIYLYPIGLIFMWVKAKWPIWAKLLLTFPLILFIISVAILIYGITTQKGVLPLPQGAIENTSITPNFAQARDVQRRADISAILIGVMKYKDENGQFPPNITSTPTDIGRNPGLINLEQYLVPKDMIALPIDPSVGSQEDTHYQIYTSGGRVTAVAKGEVTQSITLTR